MVRVLCPERGLISGLVKGGRGKASMIQPFNAVGYEHYRRLEGQLGTMTLELRVSRAAAWMRGGLGSYLVAYLSELLAAVLPEEQVYAELGGRVEALLDGAAGWREVVIFEMFLLETIGYGLRLQDVVVEEQRGEGAEELRRDEVAFVSPSSGRSVTRGAARGWEAKLLDLPYCMGGPECGEVEDFLRAWKLTGSFLGRALHGKTLAARGRLAEYLVRGMERNERSVAA